jgi:hypothetical protein
MMADGSFRQRKDVPAKPRAVTPASIPLALPTCRHCEASALGLPLDLSFLLAATVIAVEEHRAHHF